MNDFPHWLTLLSVLSLTIAGGCAAFTALDEIRRPQHMWIMNLVWPLTVLFGGLLWLAFYLRFGRGSPHRQMRAQAGRGETAPMGDTPIAVAIAKGASHCGAGCTLGDIIGEGLAFAFPAAPIAFGWRSLFAEKMFAVWILDYLVAFVLGVAFQYFTIMPTRDTSVGARLWRALKADAASITAWQVGMYGLMAVIQFLWFRPAYGHIAQVDTPQFWFAMQLAMLAGFCTAYPVNWLLVKAGVKERM